MAVIKNFSWRFIGLMQMIMFNRIGKFELQEVEDQRVLQSVLYLINKI